MNRARAITSGHINKLYAEDGAAHDWYRFVLSFPPHLIRDYLNRFGLDDGHTVLDPFCGTGTTLVECKKLRIRSVGIEANPIAYFASQTKVDWSVDPDGLINHSNAIAEVALGKLRSDGISDEQVPPLFSVSDLSTSRDFKYRTLPEEKLKLLLKNSISPLPLHKTLVLIDVINEYRDDRYYNHELLALAKSLVYSISNLHFGPEVGIGTIKKDAPVISTWQAALQAMSNDLRELQRSDVSPVEVYRADARRIQQILEPGSVDAVITSPPYPNEKDYTRTTRLESVLLGLIDNKSELQAIKRGLIRSNTRNVYKGDDDDTWISDHPEIQRIAQAIESRRIELGKTSGFEKLYSKVTKLYFGGMSRHLSELRGVLRPGGYLAYVVGDQASYFRVMIRTGQLLADIAKSLGYDLVDIDLFRSRLSTATKEQLREEVVVLRWPGNAGSSPSIYLSERKSQMPKNQRPGVPPNRYSQIMERIFLSHFEEGMDEFEFERTEIEKIAAELKINLPKNLGDLVYSFRYQSPLPEAIRRTAPKNRNWIIRPAGRSRYRFALVTEQIITPNPLLSETKIPDSTPGLVAMYSLDDEQSLLAKLRYNRLIDIFTGITCYSLQNHLRTFLSTMGQVETDEIYIGVDKKGVHYVFPVQAKGGKDKMNIVQIEQDFALCAAKFPKVICRPIGAQFMNKNLIALFEFENGDDGVKLAAERHYQLVSKEEITDELLEGYKQRLPDA